MTEQCDTSVRWCKRCEQYKQKERFIAWTTRSGAVQPRGHCLDCREHYAETRTRELIEYRRTHNAAKRNTKRERDRQRRIETRKTVDKLKDLPCADCKQRFPAVAMDFDHIGSKTKPIAMMVAQSYKLDLILEEIKRCEVVCACCHRVRTASRKQNLAPPTKSHALRDSTQDLVEDIFDLFGAAPTTTFSVADIARSLGAKYGAV